MSFWPDDTAGKIADVCSLLGLIATGVLTAGAWQVRKQLFVYPQHAAKLKAHCSQISNSLSDFADSKNAIADEIGRTKGDLNSLRPFLKGSRLKSLEQVLRRLAEYEKSPNEFALRDFLTALYQLLTEMQNLAQGL